MKVSIVWNVAEQMAGGWHATFIWFDLKPLWKPHNPQINFQLHKHACVYVLHLRWTLKDKYHQSEDILMNHHLWDFRATTWGLLQDKSGGVGVCCCCSTFNSFAYNLSTPNPIFNSTEMEHKNANCRISTRLMSPDLFGSHQLLNSIAHQLLKACLHSPAGVSFGARSKAYSGGLLLKTTVCDGCERCNVVGIKQ